MKGFKVYQITTATGLRVAAGRRDLYTICLLTGARQLQHADQEIERDGTYLFVGQPHAGEFLPRGATSQLGFGCLFTEEFVQANGLAGKQQPWARGGCNNFSPFSLGDEQVAYLTALFEKMLAEQQSTYCFKQELLRSYLHLVLHEVLRLRQPAPKGRFRYYFQLPGSAGEIGAAWRNRQRQAR
ncbi:hypothetical protein [Hymenobacter convexus]|uniref:hypothetical protein n=1 Tax=Hymenobacter sp. CA1UV-4 TaxID=3063782 RepID=UPI002712F92B|nr:hypothetical protein [Hymenobacter sp. CA1UV-4]MDO7853532.1 hypothetical protein [Hymenobacter sp. CA1UV-4]